MKKFEPEKMTDPRTGEILTLHFEDRGDGQPQLAQVTLPGPPLPPIEPYEKLSGEVVPDYAE